MKLKKAARTKKLSSLIVIPLILSLVGLFFVFEASSVKSFSEVGSSFYYFKLQVLWVILGAAVMFLLSFFDYHKFYYFSFTLMMVTVLLLVIVLIPGFGYQTGGARRWLDFGIINFQPTEIAKFSVIVYLASWFIHRERKRFFSFVFLLAVLIFLIILQPDMGTAIIVFSLSIIIYFLAGVELSYLVLLLPISFVGFLLLIKTSPYRFRRLIAFLNPASDPLGIGYHVNQILISLGNGGLLGQGFGASRQKYLFLPEAHTDSIFAIIGEEFGFLGGFLLIFVFFALMYYIYRVSAGAPDRFGRLLAGGVFAYFALQIVINLGGMVGLLPLTGVPLPFISYGGSNLLVSFALLGILINIARKSKKI